MVREIIQCQVGQCGNQIGNAFWHTISKEHKLSIEGRFKGTPENSKNQILLDKINVYYQEQTTLRYVPRVCLIDLESETLDIIKASSLGRVFKPDNICLGSSRSNNSFATGHYAEGAEIIDECIDIIRREAEECECIQGFQVTHSIGGGTGSGLGTLLLLKIRDNYPDRITSTHTVYPSPKISDIIVEPYNATLAIHQLLENSDLTFIYDNEALFHIMYKKLNIKKPKYCDLNFIISNVMSAVTTSFRFPTELNNSTRMEINNTLRKFAVNMVPFPRLHFFLLSHAPLFGIKQNGFNDSFNKLTVEQLRQQIWSETNFLASTQPRYGKYITNTCIYRGIPNGVEIRINEEDEFVEWNTNYVRILNIYKLINGYILQNYQSIPLDIVNICKEFYNENNFQYKSDEFNSPKSICSIPPLNTSKSATLIANTTSIKNVFQRISAQFAKMYKKKAFLHSYFYSGYNWIGMDEMEFQEADKNVRDLITEYQDKQDVEVNLDDIGYERDE
eukprot:156734_1